MKIKIKSREEIERTLDGCNHKDNPSCYFNQMMFNLCGEILDAVTLQDCDFHFFTPIGAWSWHQDWYEEVEDFTEEDYFIIQELDEMLCYFLESKK